MEESWKANEDANVKALGDSVSSILYDSNIRVRETGSSDPDARVVFSSMNCFEEEPSKDPSTQWSDAAAALGEKDDEQKRIDRLTAKTQDALRGSAASNDAEAETWTRNSPESAPEGYEYVNVKLEISHLGANVLRDRYPQIATTGESVAIDYGITGTRAEVLDVYSTVYDASQEKCVRVGETSVDVARREEEEKQIEEDAEQEGGS